MKHLFIVANWKSNKTTLQTKEWFQTINSLQLTFNKDNKEIIVCPSFTLLPLARELTVNSQLSIVVGAQNISPFEEGAYTGEVSVRQVKEFGEYVLIGHSERRENFSETDDILEKKVEMAKKHSLTPIFCVQGKNTSIPRRVEIVAYEPTSSISTTENSKPDTPENANEVARIIKAQHKDIMHVLYGGSVTSKNVKSFTQMPNLDGVLVGGASLDALEFGKIIQNA